MKKPSFLLLFMFIIFMTFISSASAIDVLDIDYWHACLEMVDGEYHFYWKYGPYNCSHIRVWVDDTIPDDKRVRVIIYQSIYPGGPIYYDNYVYESGNTGWIYLGGLKTNILVRIEHAENIWQYDAYGRNEFMYYEG